MLGPLGSFEFDELKNRNAITREDIFSYIDDLTQQYIITPNRADDFKERINKIYNFENEEKKINNNRINNELEILKRD